MSFEQKQYWLKGVEYERERIIKLLESVPALKSFSYSNCEQTLHEQLVELIKGENK